ncbi:hypothetical protein Enr13x_73000 [Stieleria neptunia]|uniref:ABC-2 family transporter protein n=1 Tax=Stieleria neptunia TaxID=2527979 RepID=A0A518I2R0_9BACT|nr:hypothetical protein [Stieleria neptunia]QDV47391.1 hypothetical protein Enr13x_73000 [Stieleria neptunia]
MNQKVMQRLIWKDARTLAPLAIATLAAIFGFNALLWLIADAVMDVDNQVRLGLSRMIWIVLPNLLAFGAPALLVGSEEESGSLAWLRTLPASWRGVAISKLLVAFGTLLAGWILASMLYWLQWSILPDHVIAWAENTRNVPDWSAVAVVSQWVFSIALLLTGFIMAYWFRSPINALLAVLPAMVVFAIAFVSVEEYWLGTRLQGRPRWVSISAFQFWSVMTVPIVGAIGVLFALHQWMAKRRLTGPEESLGRRIKQRVSGDAFRPPSTLPMSWYGVSLALRRPTKTHALLWQAARQNVWILLILTVVGVLGVTFAVWGGGNWEELASLMTAVALFGIAGSTFYGDSVRKRCVFLADRGVSYTLIWRTRLMPTAIACGLIFLALLVSQLLSDVLYNDGLRFNEFLLCTMLMLVGYALCQLVSQWAPRPVFAFLASPVFAVLAFLLFYPLFDAYREGALWAAMVSIPVFLFASWRLTPRWLSGATGRSDTMRFVGYFALSIVLPYMLVLGIRSATIPAEQTQWRTRMLAYEFPQRPADDRLVEVHRAAIPELAYFWNGFRRDELLLSPKSDQFDERLVQELASETSVGEFVSFNELVARVPYWPEGYAPSAGASSFSRFGADQLALELRIARVLLKWSQMVRHEARFGDSSFERLAQISEYAEWIAAVILNRHLDEGAMTPEIKELAGMFPDDSLVLESRRNSLIASWKWQTGATGFNRPMSLGNRSPRPRTEFIARIEALRRERFVDQTVKLAETHWRSGSMKGVWEIPNFVHSAEQAELSQMMRPLYEFQAQESIKRLKNRVR